MIKIKRALVLMLGLGLSLLLFSSCENDYPDSVFDPNKEGAPRPEITNMTASPTYEDAPLAGLSTITFEGTNFSNTLEDNFVFFNDVRAEVLEATPSRVVVLVPKTTIGDSVRIRCTVTGSEFYTDLIYQKIVPTVQEIGTFQSTDLGILVACDAAENVYIGMRNELIKKVSAADGKTGEFGAKPLINGNDMKVGPDDAVFISFFAGRVRMITRILQDGTEGDRLTTARNAPYGFDFDMNGNMWIAADDAIFIAPAVDNPSQVTTLPMNLNALRIYDGYVYVSAFDEDTQESKIWKLEIQDQTLGEPEEVLSLTESDWLEGAEIRDMTFSTDGKLYLGTTHQNGLFVFDETTNDHTPVYTSMLAGLAGQSISFNNLAWGNDVFLYAIRLLGSGDNETFKLLKINMLQQGAPYYGR